eukprot:CAMPEP_0177737968 /NCGR_PEP_ID=MMETSP0484_2-20121128/26184_1 /TAXON_ID=354590 /ORGANISM="Rhodomonas lens, Strain RHODO" /LENGTH=43 /DNA_ID= /DNA_START= /DNA_END= /DNA_ORIENTATION=
MGDEKLITPQENAAGAVDLPRQQQPGSGEERRARPGACGGHVR